MASSSSTNSWRYDVFLNFRGLDTRSTFTGHLFQALCSKGVNTFNDEKLERGEEICPALLHAIEKSRISIVVFSETYAWSTYCLDELVKIIECKESKRQVVFPVFYNVDPSDIEEGMGGFGEALRVYSTLNSVSREKLQKWKEVLAKAARLSGWHLDNGNEARYIESIVEKVLTILNRTFLHVADYPVGLDSHISEMNGKLSIGSTDVRMVGIWGIGGIGKTTVAKAIYNRIANQFEGSCFLANVREMSKQYNVAQLQETLLFQILGDKKILTGNFDLGINVIRERLRSKRVLIVIDDVDSVEQLKKLVGELVWFGMGSRIIITTRDEHLLVAHGVRSVHKVEELCPDDALLLFSRHAFGKPQPPEAFVELSHCVVKYAQGMPLALIVLGCFLCGICVDEWDSELDKLKRIPKKQIYEILKISYDGLEENEKAIFLDIACFFRGMDKDYVIKNLHACNFNPVIGIQVLMEKSLLRIENNKLQMHDLIQAMGRQVVHQESPNAPSRRSRLWFHEDVFHGTDEIEGIMLDSHEPEEIHLSAEVFEKMKRLRILIIRKALLRVAPVNLPNELRWLEWPRCPLSSMPPTFHGRKLVVLNMQHSFIKQFEGFKNYRSLKFVDFRDCELLTETPDFSSTPNLERLNLEGCINLVSIHQSVGLLGKLQFLSLEFCINLRSLPSSFKLKCLDTLLLTACEKLEVFPDIVEKMPCLEKLYLSGTAIKVLPSSIENITRLKVLTATHCKKLGNFPSSIYKLSHLERLLLEGCSKLGKFPVNGPSEEQSSFPLSLNTFERSSGSSYHPFHFPCILPAQSNSTDGGPSLECPILTCLDLRNFSLVDVKFLTMPNFFSMLKELDLSGNNFYALPETFSTLTNLRSLKLSECKKLREIPELPHRIKRLEARDCKSLERYSQLLSEGKRLPRLRFIDFSNCHNLAEIRHKIFNDASLSKGFCMNSQIEMCLPTSMTPEWLRHGEEGSLIFEVPLHKCEKIKALVFCAILCVGNGETANVSCQVFIDGQSTISFSRHFFSLDSDYTWFYYRPYQYHRALHPDRNGSALFEISFDVLGAPRCSTLKLCGVFFVYKNDKIDSTNKRKMR